MIKRRLQFIAKAVIATTCITTAAAVLFWADLKHYARTPLVSAPVKSEPVVFTIKSGDGFADITNRLLQLAIIKSPLKFRLFARFNGYDRKIRAGEYHLSSSQSPSEILSDLTSGKVILYKLTIPEGYNIIQIAQKVAAVGLTDQDTFLEATHDARLIGVLGITAPTLEGYLFPDTYHFPKPVNPETIIRTMTDNFKALWTNKRQQAAQLMGFSRHEILTLASIIEKETGAPEERALISSVFHNRLKKKMRLESDPTVVYGIADFNGNLTRKHLNTPGPYNTYLNFGLPPGPIASPGADAIDAALYPATTRYLFFVSKKNGTHHFSNHFTAHQQAVRKYQLNR